jgi:CubicO group peptidase (beta-lactamase class C family)
MVLVRTLFPLILSVLIALPAQGEEQKGASPAPAGFPPAVCPAPSPPAAPLANPSANAQPFRPFPEAWQAVLNGMVRDDKVPGVVAIVKSPSWGVRVGTAGVANRVSGMPISPDMQFRVGSVTKLVLAQVILQMEQEGRLRLTDPVLKHLGDNPLVAGIAHIGEITVGDLLQMKSGLPNYLGAHDIFFSPQVTPHRHFDTDDLLRPLSAAGGAEVLPPDFLPGQTYPNPYWQTLFKSQPPAPAPYPYWFYSNSNYLLLGMIAEKVGGMKADEAIRRYIAERGGLKDTYLATDETNLPHIHGYAKWGAISYPHQVFDDWCDVTAINPSIAWTAGAIVSTPWDLLKFGEAVFKSDTFLNQATKEKWFTFVSADLHPGWEPMEYGMGGLMQPHRPYGSARGHGGAITGYKALLYYFFDADTFFILAMNTSDQSREVEILDAVMPLVSSAATTPKPAAGDGAAVQLADGKAEVSWQAGRVYGSAYNVFWGTDADAVDRATGLSHDGVGMVTVAERQARIAAGRGQTIYWKVDTEPSDPAMPPINGPLWQFRTAQ